MCAVLCCCAKRARTSLSTSPRTRLGARRPLPVARVAGARTLRVIMFLVCRTYICINNYTITRGCCACGCCALRGAPDERACTFAPRARACVRARAHKSRWPRIKHRRRCGGDDDGDDDGGPSMLRVYKQRARLAHRTAHRASRLRYLHDRKLEFMRVDKLEQRARRAAASITGKCEYMCVMCVARVARVPGDD